MTHLDGRTLRHRLASAWDFLTFAGWFWCFCMASLVAALVVSCIAATTRNEALLDLTAKAMIAAAGLNAIESAISRGRKRKRAD